MDRHAYEYNIQHADTTPWYTDNACLSLSGVGWGGRGARLPKVPVPLPTSNPRKTQTLVNGPFSRSLEEVEEDLFLERVVTMGRGSRRLPTPGGTIR
jgi:hypothetical protein